MNNLIQLAFGKFIGGRGAIGLLLVRLMFGVALTIHGLPKIQHPFDWMPGGAIPGPLLALSALAEFVGGIALILGLLSPLTAIVVAINMLVATSFVAKMGAPFVSNQPGPSLESPLLYLVAALLILLAGPGTLSLDALIFGKKVGETK